MDLSIGPRINAIGEPLRLENLPQPTSPSLRPTPPEARQQAAFAQRDDNPRKQERRERSDERLKAAMGLVSQVGELIGQVRSGIEKNERQPDPPRENARLLRSAAETVRDLVENSRAQGDHLFESSRVPEEVRTRRALRAYAGHASHYRVIREQIDTPEAQVALRKAEHRLKGEHGIINTLSNLARQTIYSVRDAEPGLISAEDSIASAKQELRESRGETKLLL